MEVLGADTTRTTTCPRTPAALPAARASAARGAAPPHPGSSPLVPGGVAHPRRGPEPALAALTPRGIVRMEPPPQGAGFGGYQQHDPNNPLSIPGYEKLKRFAGFGAQALSAFANPAERDFYENLGAAWYAGGLSADMMNLPQWTEEGVEPASPEVEALLRQANVPGQEVLGPVGTRKRLVV